MNDLHSSRKRAATRFLENGHHPECRNGEMWVCNILESDLIGWKTGRVGKIAYWEGGVKIAKGLHPLFVDEVEVKNAAEHVGMHGLIHIHLEADVPHHAADEYQLVRVNREANSSSKEKPKGFRLGDLLQLRKRWGTDEPARGN